MIHSRFIWPWNLPNEYFLSLEYITRMDMVGCWQNLMKIFGVWVCRITNQSKWSWMRRLWKGSFPSPKTEWQWKWHCTVKSPRHKDIRYAEGGFLPIVVLDPHKLDRLVGCYVLQAKLRQVIILMPAVTTDIVCSCVLQSTGNISLCPKKVVFSIPSRREVRGTLHWHEWILLYIYILPKICANSSAVCHRTSLFV